MSFSCNVSLQIFAILCNGEFSKTLGRWRSKYRHFKKKGESVTAPIIAHDNPKVWKAGVTPKSVKLIVLWSISLSSYTRKGTLLIKKTT